MKKQFYYKTIFLVSFFVLAFSTISFSQSYVGSKKCGMCHKGASKGKQMEIWQASQHSKSFKVSLKSPKAIEYATAAGVAKDKIKSDAKCIKCHITSQGFKEDGVGCESCHGAGSLYAPLAKMNEIKADKSKAKTYKLLTITEATCKNCHNNTGSHKQKDFNYATFSAKIAHKKL